MTTLSEILQQPFGSSSTNSHNSARPTGCNRFRRPGDKEYPYALMAARTQKRLWRALTLFELLR